MRTEDEDHQLAEVQVPLRPVDPRYPEEGYWANAEDVVEELQDSPCPAKVYTMRGIYRQFFLRVSVDNKLEVAHANLSVNADRTIKIFIEKASWRTGNTLCDYPTLCKRFEKTLGFRP
ncbi:hypothetical protein MPER_15308 [Moniliophthora perniciosa FA553]|nr:hypothetical protein MPER_15308 [Moniliophthora perniciosa FA553]